MLNKYFLQSWLSLNPKFDFYDFNPNVLDENILIEQDIDIPYVNEKEMNLGESNTCIEYLEYLSKQDQLLLLGYTYLGDKLINNYLRNREELEYQYEQYKELRYGEFNPLFISMAHLQYPNEHISSKLYKKIKKLKSIQEYQQCIEWTIDKLNQLIDEAPPLFEGCILYRGEKSKWKEETSSSFFSRLFNIKKTILINYSFLSTSLDYDTAKSYSANKCCLKRIELQQNRKGILLGPLSYQPGEVEVLLPPGEYKYNEPKKENENKYKIENNIGTLYLKR
jgi:hypothetical protein